jgi:hypothetical protein
VFFDISGDAPTQVIQPFQRKHLRDATIASLSKPGDQ